MRSIFIHVRVEVAHFFQWPSYNNKHRELNIYGVKKNDTNCNALFIYYFSIFYFYSSFLFSLSLSPLRNIYLFTINTNKPFSSAINTIRLSICSVVPTVKSLLSALQAACILENTHKISADIRLRHPLYNSFPA